MSACSLPSGARGCPSLGARSLCSPLSRTDPHAWPGPVREQALRTIAVGSERVWKPSVCAWALGSACPCPRGRCSAWSLPGTEARECDRCQSASESCGHTEPSSPTPCLALGLGLHQLQWLPSPRGSQVTSVPPPLLSEGRAEWRLQGWALRPVCSEPWGNLRKGTDPLSQGVWKCAREEGTWLSNVAPLSS